MSDHHQAQRILAQISKSKGKKRVDLVKLYFKSKSARSVAAKETFSRFQKAKKKRAAAKTGWKSANHNQLIHRLSNNGSTDEICILDLKRKENFHEYRYLLNFGPEHTTHQIMLRDILCCIGPSHKDQFAQSGGCASAVERVANNYKQGFKYVAEVDIRKAYHGFSEAGIAQHLSLPKEIVCNVLGGSNLNIVPSTTLYKEYPTSIMDHNDNQTSDFSTFDVLNAVYPDLEDSLKGMTEGNIASAFALERLTAWILEQWPPEIGRIICYADNFLIMSKSETAAMQGIRILWELFQQHPAGGLAVKHYPTPKDIGLGAEFLGYWFISDQSGLRVWQGPRTSKKIKNAIHVIASELKEEVVNVERVNRLVDHLNAINVGLPAWTESNKYLKEKTRRVRKLATKRGFLLELVD